MQNNIEKLIQYINESKNIVFFDKLFIIYYIYNDIDFNFKV